MLWLGIAISYAMDDLGPPRDRGAASRRLELGPCPLVIRSQIGDIWKLGNNPTYCGSECFKKTSTSLAWIILPMHAFRFRIFHAYETKRVRDLAINILLDELWCYFVVAFQQCCLSSNPPNQKRLIGIPHVIQSSFAPKQTRFLLHAYYYLYFGGVTRSQVLSEVTGSQANRTANNNWKEWLTQRRRSLPIVAAPNGHSAIPRVRRRARASRWVPHVRTCFRIGRISQCIQYVFTYD